MTDEEVQRLHAALDTVEDAGAEALRRTEELVDRFDAGIREYREKASGRDDFGSYVEFRSLVATVEEAVDADEDVYGADVLTRAAERFDRRTIRPKHFDRAADDLEEIEDAVESLGEATELRDELESARYRLRRKKEELEEGKDEVERRLQRTEEHGDVDTDALVELVEEYNQRVKQELRGFVDEAPAADVVRVGARAGDLPLVPDQQVSEEDAHRLEDVAGDRTVEEVLEMTEYSDSKLGHYVDSSAEFRRAVPRSYLESFDGEAFEIGFDEPADVVRYEAPELVKVVSEFADDDTVELLRRIHRLAIDDDYERMRKAHREAGDVDEDELRGRLEEITEEKDEVEKRLRDVEEVLDRASDVLD